MCNKKKILLYFCLQVCTGRSLGVMWQSTSRGHLFHLLNVHIIYERVLFEKLTGCHFKHVSHFFFSWSLSIFFHLLSCYILITVGNHTNESSIQTNTTCDVRATTQNILCIYSLHGSERQLCCYQQLFMFLVPHSPGNKELFRLRGRDINHTLTWRFWRRTRIIRSDKVTLKVMFIHLCAAHTFMPTSQICFLHKLKLWK